MERENQFFKTPKRQQVFVKNFGDSNFPFNPAAGDYEPYITYETLHLAKEIQGHSNNQIKAGEIDKFRATFNNLHPPKL